jgi:hypothetical protein
VRVIPLGIAMGLLVPLMILVSSLWLAVVLLVLIGACAGFFVVPMNALLQHRGHMLMGAGHSIAVQNFNENLSILIMTGYSCRSTPPRPIPPIPPIPPCPPPAMVMTKAITATTMAASSEPSSSQAPIKAIVPPTPAPATRPSIARRMPPTTKMNIIASGSRLPSSPFDLPWRC